jgi:hypothetical protein
MAFPDRNEKELKDLDTSTVDFDNGEWTWGNGGHPLTDQDFFISHTDDGLTETRYKLPECISRMLRTQYRHGQEDAQVAVRAALGISAH